MLTGLGLPFSDGLQPETGEMQRTGVFFADQVHGVGLGTQFVQAHADILAVKGAQHAVFFVVELFGDEDALVAGERHGFWKTGGIDVVDRPPGTIHPVGTGLKDVVLEIMAVEEQDALFRCLGGKASESLPVPVVGTGEVIARQSIPGRALTAAGKGLFVEGCPHIAVSASYPLMVGAAEVIPESVMVIQTAVVMGREVSDDGVDAVGPSRAFPSWYETGDGRACPVFHKVVFHPAAPPGDVVLVAGEQQPVGGEVSVQVLKGLHGIPFLRFLAFFARHGGFCDCQRSMVGYAVHPHLKGHAGGGE